MMTHENSSLKLAKFPQKEVVKFLSIYTVLAALLGFIFAFVVMGSRTLAYPFAILGMAFPYLYGRRKLDREKAALGVIWPELLDHMISGLRSGLSIAETLIGLGYRGPEISRSIFIECEKFLRSGGDVAATFEFIKRSFDDPIADQVCEVLDFARGTGSRDTALTLRTLGDFIRSDMAVRGEINAKLGWVKNSALVAAIAPWILLAILSAQPSTVLAFSTPTGFLILGAGVMMSVIAYFWMGNVGRIQEIPRIFSSSVASGNSSKKMYL